ncbi:hypothetical protein [Allomeiothermus silvanus]|uniref:hypothetical protein n=1 Tax=Allomeiothermus silvanus TaxID=52022 RepID=UPI0023F1F7A2|nr:hypothetical protein [Allomeiothermus silvanus]
MRPLKLFRFALMAFGSGLALSACSGSTGEAVPQLFVAAGNQQIRFYNSLTLRPDRPEFAQPLTPLATCNVGADILDLFFDQNARKLWVLTPASLLRYDTSAIKEGPEIGQIPSFDCNQTPLPTENLTQNLSPAFTCPSGYLRAGSSYLLVVCHDQGGANLRLWRPLLGTTGLTGSDQLNLSILATLTGNARFTLGPGDGLAYVDGVSNSFTLGFFPSPTSTPTTFYQQSFTSTLVLPQLRDFRYPLGQQLYVLLSDNLGANSESVTWNPTSSTATPSAPRRIPDRGLSTLTAGQGLIVGFGPKGFARLDGNTLLPGDNPAESYQAGLISLDNYLYLGRGADLVIYDLQGDPSLISPLGPKTLGFTPTHLAYGPVTLLPVNP